MQREAKERIAENAGCHLRQKKGSWWCHAASALTKSVGSQICSVPNNKKENNSFSYDEFYIAVVFPLYTSFSQAYSTRRGVSYLPCPDPKPLETFHKSFL